MHVCVCVCVHVRMCYDDRIVSGAHFQREAPSEIPVAGSHIDSLWFFVTGVLVLSPGAATTNWEIFLRLASLVLSHLESPDNSVEKQGTSGGCSIKEGKIIKPAWFQGEGNECEIVNLSYSLLAACIHNSKCEYCVERFDFTYTHAVFKYTCSYTQTLCKCIHYTELMIFCIL